MSPDLDYAQRCIPDRWRVLGRPLLPFSVGHNLLLERVKSPFAISGKLTLQDLILAVWICERPFEQGAGGLLNGDCFSLRWFTWNASLWSAMQKNLLQTHAEAFSEYIQAGIKKPKVWTDKAAEQTYAPTVLIIARDLCNHYGYSWEYVMNMPMARAIIERYGILEKDKTISWPEPWENAK